MQAGPGEAVELEGLRQCWGVLSDADRTLIGVLLEEDQAHLFEGWGQAGEDEAERAAFLADLHRVDAAYPGGVVGYIRNARRLLEDARLDRNPFEGYAPQQPDAVDLTAFDAEYDRYEALGVAQFDRLGVVLVAGGLGERLGYGGIKLDIPVEVTTGTTYLAHYAACIRAMQARMATPRRMPLVIMTSEDTHERTVGTLHEHGWFGLDPEQVHVVKQELVPALADNQAHLALEGRYRLVLKPHGHGDIHMLLHSSGLAARFAAQGLTHLIFIQDTNGQVFNAIPAALGVSVEQDYAFNSLAVKRYPGEAAGGLAKLVRQSGGDRAEGGDRALTLNVEYNQLDALLRATVSPQGDVPDADGYSVFPGNINVLVLALAPYVTVLEKSRGVIAEFVNPKYADQERTRFKKPARLETMMQDLPKLFEGDERVGVTVFDRRWSFSANKNNIRDAAAKAEAGSPPESAASAESDFYAAGRMKLRAAGGDIAEGDWHAFHGVPFQRGARVILAPDFALTLYDVRNKMQDVQLEEDATLIVEGDGVRIEGLQVRQGSGVRIKAKPGEQLRIQDLVVDNAGCELVPLTEAELQDAEVPEFLRIRGYRILNRKLELIESA
jgi:UDP-sugar pyrophosphorylase